MLREVFHLSLFKRAFEEWQNDKASRLGAALAYYTIFSLAPLMLILIGICSLVFGQEAAQGQILDQLRGMLGKESAEAVQTMLANSNEEHTGLIATLVGFGALFAGATGVFAQLQDALDTVWRVPSPAQNGVWLLLKTRWAAFTMVLGIGFLLLVSLVISSVISGVGELLTQHLPFASSVLQLVNVVLSLAVITILFAMIFKYLPNVRLAWSDVWTGAFVTAVLFNAGKLLIGMYLGNGAVGSAFGGAGAIVIILVWTYYSAQILLFGAEFTRIFAETHGTQRQAANHR